MKSFFVRFTITFHSHQNAKRRLVANTARILTDDTAAAECLSENSSDNTETRNKLLVDDDGSTSPVDHCAGRGKSLTITTGRWNLFFPRTLSDHSPRIKSVRPGEPDLH